MKLEKQVPLFHYCVKLNELGIEQKSLFYWKENDVQTVVTESQMKTWIDKYLPTINNNYYSAYTLSELGAMLDLTVDGVMPEKFNNKEINAWFEINAKYYQSEIDLRAGILIYLLSSNLLSVKTCNKRLLQ